MHRDEHDMLLIPDEIQSDGTYCSMFVRQQYGEADCQARDGGQGAGKRRSGGRILASGKAASAMVPGDHGTTYGGNPLENSGGRHAVLGIFEERADCGACEFSGRLSVRSWKNWPHSLTALPDTEAGADAGAGVPNACRSHRCQKALLEENWC